MELETIVLEESALMDRGEAQEAYNSYLQVRDDFRIRRDDYKALIAEFKSRDPFSIANDEIEKADALYEDVKRIQRECLDMKAVLSRKLEDLVLAGKGLESDLAYHAREFGDVEGMEWGRSLLKETLELRDKNEITDALEKAYQARQYFAALLAKTRQVWMQKHQENVDSLSVEHAG